MSGNAGIWIDRQHAFLVSILNNGENHSQSVAGKVEQFSTVSKSISRHSHTPHDFQPEDRIERKEHATRKRMYDTILSSIIGIDSLLVLGPGEAKKEFAKYIGSKGLKNLSVEIETSDKMTEPQFVAKVIQHFATTHIE